MNTWEYALRNNENWDGLTMVWVGIFILLAITRSLYPKRFQEFIMLPVSDKYFKLQGKGYEVKHPFNVLLFTVQSLSFSLFIYLTLATIRPSIVNENEWIFLQITTGFAGFALIKYIFEKIIAHILNIEQFIGSYLYEKLNYMNLLSMVLFLINIVFILAIKPDKTALLGVAFFLLLLYVIALISSFKRKWGAILNHFSYFILYLCALEIAPYIILYHLIV